jgi:hypothetical protein
MTVFWIVVPCSLVEVYRRFRGACCLHHQVDRCPNDGQRENLKYHLFVCCLFKEAASTSDYKVSNNELEIIWKEAVVAYFTALSRNLSGETENNPQGRKPVPGPRSEEVQYEQACFDQYSV